MRTPLFTFLIFTWLTSNAVAWDDLGHMMVGAIAYDQLTPEVQEKVSTLLKLHPNYGNWIAHVSKNDRSRIAFLRASRWPDDIKLDPAYKQDGRQNGNRPSGRKAGRNIGYTDKLMHKYWHFIDLPFSPDDTKLTDPPTPNAKTQIGLLRATLKSSRSSMYLKSYDLVWLIHLVGDVHQPLHAVSRFDKAHMKGDDGGNGVLVCGHPCATQQKLHAFWDDILGVSTDPVVAIERAKQLPAADLQLVSINDESVWIQESFDAARMQVYAGPIGVGGGPYELSDEYIAAAQELAARRIALAGGRLAGLLNDALR